MYPAYLASALVGCTLAHQAFATYLDAAGYAATSTNGAISGLYILMLPFCASAWHPALRLANAANGPSFARRPCLESHVDALARLD